MENKGALPAGHVSGQSNRPLSRPAHALQIQDTLNELGSDGDNGLQAAEASSRLSEFGQNTLGDSKAVNPWSIFLNQIANAMTLVSLNVARLPVRFAYHNRYSS